LVNSARTARFQSLSPFVTPRPAGVIGIDDGTYAALPEINHAISPVETVEDTPPVVRGELLPDRVEQPVGEKEVNMEVHDRLRR
jgi:hypothetical protein